MKKTAIVILTIILLTMALMPTASAVKKGETAPDFELETLDGGVFQLSEQRGKVVYLNLWATWCPPCVMEIPDIMKLAEAHPDDLVVIGASVDTEVQEVRDFIDQNNVTYPVGMDKDFHLIGELFPSQYIPESVFISPNGVLVEKREGMLTYAQMEHMFEKALAQ